MKKKKGHVYFALAEFILIITIALAVRTFGYGLYRVPSGSMETTMLVGELFFSNKFAMWVGSPDRGDVIAFNDPVYPYADNICVRLWQEYFYGPANWTKRVVGVPGDRVRGVIEDGSSVLYVNGKRYTEKYVNQYPLIGVRAHTALSAESELVFKSFDPDVSYEDQILYSIDANTVVMNVSGKPVVRKAGRAQRERTLMNTYKNGANYWNGSDEFYVELQENQYWVMGDNRRNSYDSRMFGPLDRRFIHGRISFRVFSVDSYAAWILVDLLNRPSDFLKKIRWYRCWQLVS